MVSLILLAGVLLSVLGSVLLPRTHQKVAITHGSIPVLLVGILLSHQLLRADIPILLWLAVVVASALDSNRIQAFIPQYRRGSGTITSVAWGLTALAALRLTLPLQLIMLYAAVGAGILSAVATILQQLKWKPILNFCAVSEQVCQPGLLTNSAFAGAYFILLLPFILLHHWYLIAGLYVVGLGLTQCRAAILGFLITCPPVLAFASVSTLKPHLSAESLLGRVYCWGYALKRWVRKPVLGWGHNSMVLPAPDLKSYAETAHCELLDTMMNHGILGAAVLLWIWKVALISGPHGLVLGLIAYGIWLMLTGSQVGVANLGWALLGICSVGT